MAKQKFKAFDTFYATLNLYLKHMRAFFSYLTFPIIGQVAGMVITFVLNYHFIVNLDVIQQHIPAGSRYAIRYEELMMFILAAI